MANDTITPERVTRNITSVFRSGTAEQVAKGLAWYDVASDTAESFAGLYGVTFEVAAGVIAALSPNNSWGHNVRLAERFVAQGGLTEGYFKANLEKASRILAGEDIPTVLNGRKTTNFYRSIITRGLDGITIDRHAWAIAVNQRGATPSLSAARYGFAVAGYERAASRLAVTGEGDLTAAQVQAITWVIWRDRFWSAGAWE